jgi:signal transduction histidine kinase
MARLVPRRQFALDALAALGLILLPGVTMLRPAAGDSGGVAFWLLTAAAALPLVVCSIWPVAVFAVVLLASCLALTVSVGPTSFLAAAYALYRVAVSRPQERGPSTAQVAWASGGGAFLLATAGGQTRAGAEVAQVMLGGVVMGATWAAGRAVYERRESTRRAIEQAASRATMEERLRIAREMHDVVTHSLGLIAVQAGIANHVVESRPEQARDTLVVIESVSRSALREMRTMLGVLRATDAGEPAIADLHPAPRLGDLPDLVEAARAGGVEVSTTIQLDDELPHGVELSAYRIVQEALTNVVRHAAPTRCRVSVAASAGQVRIEVSDDGPAAGRIPPAGRSHAGGAGFGLVGIRERAAVHGGSARAEARAGGGFTVTATLPYGDGPAHDPNPRVSLTRD